MNLTLESENVRRTILVDFHYVCIYPLLTVWGGIKNCCFEHFQRIPEILFYFSVFCILFQDLDLVWLGRSRYVNTERIGSFSFRDNGSYKQMLCGGSSGARTAPIKMTVQRVEKKEIIFLLDWSFTLRFNRDILSDLYNYVFTFFFDGGR